MEKLSTTMIECAFEGKRSLGILFDGKNVFLIHFSEVCSGSHGFRDSHYLNVVKTLKILHVSQVSQICLLASSNTRNYRKIKSTNLFSSSCPYHVCYLLMSNLPYQIVMPANIMGLILFAF